MPGTWFVAGTGVYVCFMFFMLLFWFVCDRYCFGFAAVFISYFRFFVFGLLLLLPLVLLLVACFSAEIMPRGGTVRFTLWRGVG